ncbi:lanthionine synthetase C family protein [Nonomuraea sp. NN258]|uniref:lanthionine synthetase C family protein n=1 Tax=Nonomuraea antri TaxID=2730852 RepID=UPI001567F3EC|nr:lanthionine synthetase C family protein [Nonomuraea antri]NRQ30638.1 lanthionine synthetase C family protein [Nonomuraea antri]
MSQTTSEALAAANAIAEALADPQQWTAEPPGSGLVWPQSLWAGAAGIALLHIERAHSGHGDPRIAHAWVQAAASGALTAAPNANLFFGAPALAFTMRAAAGRSGRYRRALKRLDDTVTAITRTRLAAAHARIDRGEQPEMKEFDLVRGLTGLETYHLSSHPDRSITIDVLSYLVRLAEPLPAGGELPPWWTSVAPNGEPSSDYPEGHGNLGMSHGISSVLALLSLAVLRDVPVAGAKEAIERICSWTDTWRQHDHTGAWWPGTVTIDQAREQRIDPSQRPRPSWCYGVSGTARAQQLAGLALVDENRQRSAERAMLATLRDPVQLGRLTESGLCHGIAGLLQSAWRMAADARTPQLGAELPSLASQLAAEISRSAPQAGFLDGVAGAALALHALGTGAVLSSWDTALLLA